MTRPSTLAALQQAFGSLSTQASARAELTPDQLVHGGGTLSPSEGMQIYANMFIWRQVDSLLEDFPKLASLVGDDFYALCRAYLTAYPSQHHSLARLGHSLSRFLKADTERHPGLSDLAALEAARNEVFDEAAVPTLAAPRAVDRPLSIIPALRCLWLEYDVAPVWRAIEDGEAVMDMQRTRTCIIVWRKDFEVFHVRLDPREAQAFALAAAGNPLAEICEAFADDPEPLQAASRAIGSWFSECWIAH